MNMLEIVFFSVLIIVFGGVALLAFNVAQLIATIVILVIFMLIASAPAIVIWSTVGGGLLLLVGIVVRNLWVAEVEAPRCSTTIVDEAIQLVTDHPIVAGIATGLLIKK